jgi:hypothetical protein
MLAFALELDALIESKREFTMTVSSIESDYVCHLAPGGRFIFAAIDDFECNVAYTGVDEVHEMMDLLFGQNRIMKIQLKYDDSPL